MLFVPGNNPGMLADAHIYGSDSVMFDLEDSVSLGEKDAARMLVYNALKTIDYGEVETVVRVNPLNTPYGAEDIKAMVAAGVQVIRMPKTETAQDVIDTEKAIEEAEKAYGREVGSTKILTAIESALGIVNAYAIATASSRIIGIALGAEDYAANLKTTRSKEGTELFYARSAIVVAARAAGVDAEMIAQWNIRKKPAHQQRQYKEQCLTVGQTKPVKYALRHAEADQYAHDD